MNAKDRREVDQERWKGETMSDQAAAHPVWSSDNEALKDEFRHVEARQKFWEDAHSRVDSQAERFQTALEDIGRLAPENAADGPQIALSALERWS